MHLFKLIYIYIYLRKRLSECFTLFALCKLLFGYYCHVLCFCIKRVVKRKICDHFINVWPSLLSLYPLSSTLSSCIVFFCSSFTLCSYININHPSIKICINQLFLCKSIHHFQIKTLNNFCSVTFFIT